MVKKILFLCAISYAAFLLYPTNADASGFDRLKAAGQGVSTNKSDDEGGASSDSEGGNAEDIKAAQHDDLIFLGVYEAYVPSERTNAKITVFGEPRDFKFGHRACTRMIKIRDKINTHLFKHPPEMSKRGVVDTEGMKKGINQAIKDGLRTDLEYFTSLYIFPGAWGLFKAPEEIRDMGMTDCAGMIQRKADMDKK